MTLRDVLLNASKLEDEWLYLPAGDAKWSLDTPAYILAEEEVAPEEEDEPMAGYPQFAKDNGLRRVLLARDVQGIVKNTKQQRPNADADTLFQAFLFYFEHDAFIDLSKVPTTQKQ